MSRGAGFRMWQDGMVMEENSYDALSQGFSSIAVGVCACQGCNYSALKIVYSL